METSAHEAVPPSTVLVVDDERGPLLALQLILQRQFRVLTAESGEEALEILKAEPVDAITLDLKMPGLAGQNTLSLIRGLDPNLPVVIITGYGSYESAVKALRLHAFDYISKPFDSNKILMAIEHAVEERRRGRAHALKDLAARIGALLEAADWLERSAGKSFSSTDRAALESIRTNALILQEHFRARAETDDQTFDLFHSRKEHG